MKPHVTHNSGRNEWYTPPEYIEAARAAMGTIDLDPASSDAANQTVQATTYYTIENSGLAQPWRGSVWMNPPYSQPLIEQFTARLVDQYVYGSVDQAVVLVNNATETRWFQRLLQQSAAVCLPKKRVRFLLEGAATGAPLQGQAVLYLGEDVGSFEQASAPFGAVLYTKQGGTK